MDGIDNLLRKIERKLGIEDEEVSQKFFMEMHRRMQQLENSNRELRRKVFGEEPSGATVAEANYAGDTTKLRNY